jgi:NAD-dependent deacetylase
LNEVATPEGFARGPDKVLAFYNMRKKVHADVAPNAAHRALARLEEAYPGKVLTITQNIDELHELAGSRNLIHMHGEIYKALCAHCGHRRPWREDFSTTRSCQGCNACGGLRPDVVWFGEMPYRMEEIYAALSRCDLFVSIGTSGTVYPAAGFVIDALQAGAHTVELNLEPSEGVTHFAEARHGKATEIVPAFVEELLGGGHSA